MPIFLKVHLLNSYNTAPNLLLFYLFFYIFFTSRLLSSEKKFCVHAWKRRLFGGQVLAEITSQDWRTTGSSEKTTSRLLGGLRSVMMNLAEERRRRRGSRPAPYLSRLPSRFRPGSFPWILRRSSPLSMAVEQTRTSWLPTVTIVQHRHLLWRTLPPTRPPS